ncbi:hypothetical protein GCM10022393_05320 [Aquimarina addita]|uniref:Uncharacterized protein n=1 Tax=Aquimarina addita TaxID=870485 RepID=A0ABP7XAE9_9FLAO
MNNTEIIACETFDGSYNLTPTQKYIAYTPKTALTENDDYAVYGILADGTKIDCRKTVSYNL